MMITNTAVRRRRASKRRKAPNPARLWKLNSHRKGTRTKRIRYQGLSNPSSQPCIVKMPGARIGLPATDSINDDAGWLAQPKTSQKLVANPLQILDDEFPTK